MNESKKLINLSFEQALIEKNKYPNNIISKSNGDWIIIIAPNAENDFKKFYEYFFKNSSEYTDELCKQYSSDGKFQVREHLISALK